MIQIASDTRLLLAIATCLVAALAVRRWPLATPPQQRPGRPWLLPVVTGVAVVGLVTWCWGGWRAPAVVDDEAAYLLQAQLFARGLWKLPAPAVPAAFTQSAVLVTPVLAPKMPPGHALLLAAGAAVGLPGLIPILLSGLTALLLVILVRRAAGESVALLTVAIWLTQIGQMRWRASYFSEMTTGMLWLLGWWLLWRWRDTGRARWLVGLSVVTAWGGITRPLTMLAFALPVGVVVLHDAMRHRRYRQVVVAGIAGCGVLLLLPIQNRAVLGDWRRSPLQLYTRQYMPFDVIGFGFDSTSPTIGLPPNLQQAQTAFMADHRQHEWRALPGILGQRLVMLWRTDFWHWREVFIPMAAVGLLVAGGAGWFAIASMVVLYLAYLLYAHEPYWTIYYLETTPIQAFVCAVGLAWCLARIGRVTRVPAIWGALLALAVVAIDAPELVGSRQLRASGQAQFRRFDMVPIITGSHHALVFVRYAGDHDPDVSLVRNVADPDHAPLLTAFDRGDAADREVLAAYPGRDGFVWDEATNRLRRVGSP